MFVRKALGQSLPGCTELTHQIGAAVEITDHQGSGRGCHELTLLQPLQSIVCALRNHHARNFGYFSKALSSRAFRPCYRFSKVQVMPALLQETAYYQEYQRQVEKHIYSPQ